MLRTKAERISRRVYQWQQVEKIERKAIEDCVEEDLKTAGVTKFTGKHQGDRMTLCDIAEDREQWRELVALASMAESRGVATGGISVYIPPKISRPLFFNVVVFSP